MGAKCNVIINYFAGYQLGNRRLNVLNKFYLLKSVWKLRCGGDSLWCNVLKDKYGTNAHDLDIVISKMSGSSIWKKMSIFDLILRSLNFALLGVGITSTPRIIGGLN